MSHPLFQVVGPFTLSLLALGFAKLVGWLVRRVIEGGARQLSEAESIRAEMRLERDTLRKERDTYKTELQTTLREVTYWRQRVMVLWDEANRCRQRDGLGPLPEEKMPPAMEPPWEQHIVGADQA